MEATTLIDNNISSMTNQEKGTAGRKKLPDGEKKKMIRVFIKEKHAGKALTEIKEIEKKYEN